MERLIECVPNFSEGRDRETIDRIAAAIASLRKQRFLLVNGPVPACAMDGKAVAFLIQKDTGLIELVEALR